MTADSQNATRRARSDHDRLAEHVRHLFASEGRWPTVRDVCRSFGWNHDRLGDAVEGDPDCRMMTTSFGGSYEPFGSHFVELYEPPLGTAHVPEPIEAP